MERKVLINGETLTVSEVSLVSSGFIKVEIDPYKIEGINKASAFIDKISKKDEAVYGINTGFGKLSSTKINEEDLIKLQENLIKSHSVGVGRSFQESEARAIMLIRANTLTSGYSGVRKELIDVLVELLNKKVYPLIPSQGSVGASGDLAPLSHLMLVLLGMGKAKIDGVIYENEEVLKKLNLRPIVLKPKEGLAFINGTAVMSAIFSLALYEARVIFNEANIIAALSLEAGKAEIHPFDERIHRVRKHYGQIYVASFINNLFKDSKLIGSMKKVQDAYVFRCVPQVHGAILDTLDYLENVMTNEINAATDNPLVFPDDEAIISGGNFHGEPVAFASDFLSITMSELGNMSERRINRLLNPALNNNLPAFLAKDPGLNSGLMVAQYTAASLVSENKVLSHPASVDSIPLSADQEDHVSMGTYAARKSAQIVENTAVILAIELLAALQAIDFLGSNDLSPKTKKAYEAAREITPFIEKDRIIADDIIKLKEFIKHKGLQKAIS